MNRQLRIIRPQGQRKRRDQPEAGPHLPEPSQEQADLGETDDIVLEIVAERIGDRSRHEKVNAIDDERIYNDNQQKGGQ